MSGVGTFDKKLGYRCIDTVDKELEKVGVAVDWGFMICPRTGITRTRAQVKVRKLDPKSRKSMPVVAATYCPFCGKEYPQ